MITLFRRIRQKFIASGFVSKYLLYATGEVALVMIGILLALQVNNWNEERLERQKEQEILQDLKVEFEANLFDLQRVLNAHRKIYAELKEIQQITLSGDFENPALDSLTFALVKWFTFTDRPGASSNLLNSGNLNLISNKELRDLITQWSGIVADVVDDEIFSLDYVRETVMPFLVKNYSISNLKLENDRMIRSFDEYNPDLFEPVKPRETVDWSRLLTDSNFQGYLAFRKIFQAHSIMEGEIGEKAGLEILRLIDEELGIL